MKALHRLRTPGFTLMETVLALLLLSIISVGIINLNSQLFWKTNDLKKWQPGMQLMQGCMELLLATARPVHFAAATGSSTICNSLNNASYTLSVTYGAITSNCVDTLACRQVEVGVSGVAGRISLEFVNY